jgi:hypothetical protein
MRVLEQIENRLTVVFRKPDGTEARISIHPIQEPTTKGHYEARGFTFLRSEHLWNQIGLDTLPVAGRPRRWRDTETGAIEAVPE